MTDSDDFSATSNRRLRWRSIVQFRLSTFLVFVTICAMAISYREHIRNKYQSRQVIVDYLIDSGASVRLTPKRPRLMALFIGQELYRDVVSIDFQHQRIEDKDLRLLQGLDGCERLYLADTRISDAGLAHIAHLTNLKRISLWKTRVTNDGLKHLAAMSELEAIDLDHTKVDNNGLRLLRDKLSLRELSLSDWMSDRGLQHLSNLKNLRKLNINRAAVSIRGIKYLSDSQLDTIEADRDYVINRNLTALLQLPHIKYLRKVSAKTNADVALISERLEPSAIELEGPSISDEAIPAILKLKTKGLALVSLRGTSISKGGLQKLRKGLGKTVITQYPASRDNASVRRSTNAAGRVSMVIYGPNFTAGQRQALSDAIDVHGFYIFHSSLDDELLATFSDSHQFEFMFLEHSNFTCSNLSTIQQLERLRLFEVTLNSDVIDALARLPNLESINIERCTIPPDAIARLSQSKSLRTLHLVGRSGFRAPLLDQHMLALKMMTRLETLDLSYTDFNDDGCTVLKNLTNLRTLNLTGTFITGKSRPILEGLPNLEEISVSSRMARVQPAKSKER